MLLDRSVPMHAWLPSSLTSLMLVAGCLGGGGARREALAPAPYGSTSNTAAADSAYMPPAHASSAQPTIVQNEPVPERPGLGTSYGEQLYAPISFAPFQRASSSPWAEVALHYNDVDGVNAHAQYLGT